ncbi:hypothetical protein [Ramlibacter rhizophilus]|uniref:Uncharacterized protein n=1 Tax=Ramlibacter rhizophilus TaxID=1781167 RepID=A0A4Z0C0H2_9BURK|nr:hypothetical protein [Ramlibacter rhizophilus]TFZ05033.1 hypothetical protein EZ242_04605 [Ramlibacter rhizophilus]
MTASSPYWVSASGPARIGALGPSRLALAPGSEARVLLPALGWLRIEADARGQTPMPQVRLSTGTGLSIEANLLPGVDGRSWLLKTQMPQPMVAHIVAPPGGSAHRYGLYVARTEVAPTYAVPDRLVPLPAPASSVRPADQAREEPYARLDAGHQTEVTLQGPARFRLEARLAGAADPAQTLLAWRAAIGARADALPLVRLPSGSEWRAPVEVDGAWRNVGRLERFEFEVPEGSHRVALTPSHPVLARLWELQGPDLTLALNTPAGWSALVPSEQDTPWVQEALTAATANRWRDAGSRVVERLNHAARERPDRPDLARLARELDGLVGLWRAVPSSGAAAPGELLWAATPSPTAVDPLQDEGISPRSPAAAPDAPPGALFQWVATQPLRFELPRGQGPRRMRLRVLEPRSRPAVLELQDDRGLAWRVRTGPAALGPGELRSQATAEPGADGQTVPRLDPVLLDGGEVQWWLPEGSTRLTLRALEGSARVALDWRDSADLRLDDGVLATLAARFVAGRSAAAGDPTTALAQDAWRTVDRLLQASFAQLAAGSSAVARPAPIVEARAQGLAALARQESDPATSLARWRSLLGAADARLRSEALEGMAAALYTGGERFAAQQLLRSFWLGEDPALSAAALQALQALYRREGDDEALLTLTTAAAARDPAHLAALAILLARAGEDRLALVAALTAPRRPPPETDGLLPALLGSALRAELPATFEALIAGVRGEQPAMDFWRGQQALHRGDPQAALVLFERGGHTQWLRSVRQALELSRRLAGGASLEAVRGWGDWQSAHPGPRYWTAEESALVAHAGGLVARSIARDLRSTWWRAEGRQPAVLQVAGPARVRVEARPLHASADQLLEGWLRIEADGQLWVHPYSRNRSAVGLALEGAAADKATLGERVERIIELPPGFHELRVHAADQPLAIRYAIERPALQAQWLLPPPTAPYFSAQDFRAPQRIAAPACGFAGACALELDDPLQPFHVLLAGRRWPGAPAPAPQRDASAARLAGGDPWGAVDQAQDPAEKMRLLAWIAQTRPADRARALATAAAVRGRSTDPDMLSAWQQLSEASEWVHQPLVARSAGLRAVPATPGEAHSPAARLRAALLEPLEPDELRLSGDSRAVFSVTDPGPSRTRVRLRSEDLPGLPPQPLRARVLVDGREHRTLELPAPGTEATVSIELPAGEHDIAVSSVDTYANQLLRVRFEHAGPALPELRRDWQIATRDQPVEVAVAAPAWLRVDRRTAAGELQSEDRYVEGDELRTIRLPAAPGEEQTLYRVYLRRPQAAPVPPRPPRPSPYLPNPVPELALPWAAATEGPAPSGVRFIDPAPVARLLDYTWTTRLALRQRRDTEATGGAQQTREERFAEVGVSAMQRSADGQRWGMADAFARAHRRGDPVLGLRVEATQAIDWWPAFPHPLELAASAVSVLQSTPAGLGASVQAELAVAQTRRLAPSLAHRPQVGAFVRLGSLRDVPASELDHIDTDVYSRYRESHRFGLRLADALSWYPHRDTKLALRGRIVSNENLTPDNVRLEVQAQQLAGPWLMAAGVRHTRYFSDRHRARAVGVTEPVLSLQRDFWRPDGSRLALRGVVRRDSLTGSVTAGIELEWHHSAGRRLWDLGPGERDFRELREWQTAPLDFRVEDVR